VYAPGPGLPGIGLPGRPLTPLIPLTLPALRGPLIPVARGPCDHARAETGYHPSRTLQHLIRARNSQCTAPGCRRPAASCDLDHTHPWDQGGATCECNLAPLCRHHHRCKQAEPGVLIWRTGRTQIHHRPHGNIRVQLAAGHVASAAWTFPRGCERSAIWTSP
jgi:hypothetical protein